MKLRKDKIVNLVGASGSGKTTIAKELEKKGFNIIQSYSTRKPRYEGEWGHTFLDVDDGWYRANFENSFVGMSKLNNSFEVVQYIDIDDMIAYFNDYDNDEHYFATYDQYQGKGTSIYIVDPDGAEQVKRNVGDAEVITIYLDASQGVRVLRTHEREDFAKRIDKDKEIFKVVKCDYKVVKCDYKVDANGELEEVLEDVIRIIENV